METTGDILGKACRDIKAKPLFQRESKISLILRVRSLRDKQKSSKLTLSGNQIVLQVSDRDHELSLMAEIFATRLPLGRDLVASFTGI